MADFFIYNNDGVLPEYIPGIPGYGQMGSTGDTGDTGASVYYCSFDLNNSDELATANSYIRLNKELSNNIDSQISGEYVENDIIIDCTGGIYRLVSNTGALEISQYDTKTNASIYTSDTESITGLDVYCATAFLNTSVYCWKVSGNYEQAHLEKSTTINEYGAEAEFDSTYIGVPHKVRYRNKIEGLVYGNYVRFSLQTHNVQQYNQYTYVLCFPNGQAFRQVSKNTDATFFIDNRYIYGMFDMKTWMCGSMKLGTGERVYGIANLASDTLDKPLAELIEFNGVNRIYSRTQETSEILPEDSSMNGEWKKDVTVLCSEFIKNNCTAYVDIFNTKTNKMYRVDFDDIFLSSNSDENGDTHLTVSGATNIESAKNNIIWKVHNYPALAWLNMTDNTYDMDAFVPFVVDDASTVDEYSVRCFYVNGNARSAENQRGALESYINSNIVSLADFKNWDDWMWRDSSAGNRVVRVYFRNLQSFSLSIKYNSKGYCTENGIKSEETSYPTTMVYVGAPDCNLIQYGKDSSWNDKIQEDEFVNTTGIIDDCDAGIYYLNKFVAPGIDTTNMSGNVMEAGLTDYTLTCTDFGLNPTKYHYIEIGFVPFTVGGKEYHANIPETNLNDPKEAVPQRRMFYDPEDRFKQAEILPFHIAGNDAEGDPVSGDFDLSLNLYAIVDSMERPNNTQDYDETSYNPVNFVYKDIV